VTCSLETFAGDSTHLYRLAYAPNAWQFPDWSHAREGGTFGNRWDDPQAIYRVLYASAQRVGTFLETLARYRPDPMVAAALDEISGDDEPLPGPGFLPRRWIADRVLGEADSGGTFARVSSAHSLDYLRVAMAGSLVRHGIDDLDAATIRQRSPRSFTQEISRLIYECTEDDRRSYDGVYYESRLGDEIQNFALFEPAALTVGESVPLDESDPDLQGVLLRFGITLYDE